MSTEGECSFSMTSMFSTIINDVFVQKTVYFGGVGNPKIRKFKGLKYRNDDGKL